MLDFIYRRKQLEPWTPKVQLMSLLLILFTMHKKTRKLTYENISYIIKRCTLWSRICWRFLSTCDQSLLLLRRVDQTLVVCVCMYIWLFVFYLLCRVFFFLRFMSLTIPLVYSASLILYTFYTLSNDSIVIQYWNSRYYYTSQQMERYKVLYFPYTCMMKLYNGTNVNNCTTGLMFKECFFLIESINLRQIREFVLDLFFAFDVISKLYFHPKVKKSI